MASEERSADRRADRDRRNRPRFLARERRGGFDRRSTYAVTGRLHEDPLALAAVLVTVNVLSMLDALLTSAELSSGVATEGNPVLSALLDTTGAGAWTFKALVVLGVSVLVWRGRRYRAVLAMGVVALAVYAAVNLYHLLGLTVLS